MSPLLSWSTSSTRTGEPVNRSSLWDVYCLYRESQRPVGKFAILYEYEAKIHMHNSNTFNTHATAFMNNRYAAHYYGSSIWIYYMTSRLGVK